MASEDNEAPVQEREELALDFLVGLDLAANLRRDADTVDKIQAKLDESAIAICKLKVKIDVLQMEIDDLRSSKGPPAPLQLEQCKKDDDFVKVPHRLMQGLWYALRDGKMSAEDGAKCLSCFELWQTEVYKWREVDFDTVSLLEKYDEEWNDGVIAKFGINKAASSKDGNEGNEGNEGKRAKHV